MVPKWALPIIEKIAGHLPSYFGDELGVEMESLSKLLDMPQGEVVLLNLVMQVEGIGVNCSNWNNTGPTVPDDPGCMDVDPKQSW